MPRTAAGQRGRTGNMPSPQEGATIVEEPRLMSASSPPTAPVRKCPAPSSWGHLMKEEGLPLAEAVVQGSRERLAPVLMTALTAGLALIPPMLAGGEPGNDIQSPMAQVILGGLLSSTFLNLVLVPVLFARWGGDAAEETAV